MSWENLATVLKMTEGINSTEKYLLFMLAYYHNDEFDRCDPSVERLSRDVLRSKRHVQRTLRSLARRGIITIRERSGTSHQYDLQLLTREPDVTCDVVSHVTSETGTREPDVIRTKNITSSEGSPSENSSSSAEEEEEDFLNRVTSFYSSRLAADHRFSSSVPAPGPYFRTVRENGGLPVSDLDACWEFAEEIHAAVNIGYPNHKIVTFPGPASLPGLAASLAPLRSYCLRPQFVRLALYRFCEGDGQDPPELQGSDVLDRISKRPDLFAEALRQQSEALG